MSLPTINESKISLPQTLVYYWGHAKRYPKSVLGVLVFIPLAVITNQYIPTLIGAYVIDRLTSGAFDKTSLWQSFGPAIAAYIAAIVMGGVVFWRIAVYFNWTLELKVKKDIYKEMFNHLLKLDANFHANSFGGSLVSRTNKLAGSYVRIADAIQFQIYTLLIALSMTTVILLPRAPIIVALMWVSTAVCVTLLIIMTKKVRKLNALEADRDNELTGYLADAVTNVMAVKSFATRAKEAERYELANEKLRKAGWRVMWGTTKIEAMTASMNDIMLSAAFILSIAAVVVYNAEVSTVFLVFSYFADITQRLWELNTSGLRNINRGLGDAAEGIATLATTPKILDQASPEKSRIKNGHIQLNSVTFSHTDNVDDALFSNFGLDIKAGERVGLVGRSGSGKTSLTRLLLRYSDLDGGTITIDGQDITAIRQDDLRSAVAYVPQEPLLFHRSIAENIAYGTDNVDMQRVKKAAKQAFADIFIDTLPSGYDTLVGERGVKLSGGQRQRVAIARALLKDAPILVLDEATSALDSESEAYIQSALWRLMQGRTAIVIAHRLSTVQKMDRIVVLDNGAVVEQGSHAALLKKDGVYASLWKRQSGGFMDE